MWTDNSTFYQIYTLGFCGAPKENDGVTVSRIKKVMDFSDHYKKLGVDTIFFNPLFQSDKHGYDTRDYYTLDCRLGTNQDFKEVCDDLHSKGLKVVLDGVFNHVGRGFWAFQDVLQNREGSKYCSWFNIDFGGNSGYNDGFYYEGWEGHYELVKLNLNNNEVVEHLLNAVRMWVKEFNIDGIRLDVAYCLSHDFLRRLRDMCNKEFPQLVLIGEVLFGDYNLIVNDQMLHSCTNYEVYKGMHSSINSDNLCEISYSMNRQFGPDQWTIYKGKHLMSFLDNHDVSRLATIINNKNLIPVAYGMLFTCPGIPCLYYGSEWGALGDKANGDDGLRPSFEKPEFNELTEYISKLIKIRKENIPLCNGGFKNLVNNNKQWAFEREYDGKRILVAINIENCGSTLWMNTGYINGTELITGEPISFDNSLNMPAESIKIISVG